MTTTGVLRARAVLGEHGMDPNADADALAALLEARGWRVSLESVGGGGLGRPPRWRGLATLAAPPGSPVDHRPAHVSVSGADVRSVVVRLLAKALESERKGRVS